MDDQASIETLAGIAGALFVGGAVALATLAGIAFRMFMGHWPTPRNGKAVDTQLESIKAAQKTNQKTMTASIENLATSVHNLHEEYRSDAENQWKQISQNREDVARLEGRVDAASGD